MGDLYGLCIFGCNNRVSITDKKNHNPRIQNEIQIFFFCHHDWCGIFKQLKLKPKNNHFDLCV